MTTAVAEAEDGELKREVLYETRVHSSGPCSPNYPPLLHQRKNDGSGVLSSLLSTKGLSQLKERWTGSTQPKKAKRWVSLFVSPKGERVAVAVGNHITILHKDDDYQEPCGKFTSGNLGAFAHGAWSESHGVLGVVDNMDTLYFIKSNGEEIVRIERKHLKVSLPIVALFVSRQVGTENSFLCNFNFLTSDGTLHYIEICPDSSASISSMRTCSDIKRQFSGNFICLDYNSDHSLLAVVGDVSSSLTASGSAGSCSLSLWRWGQSSQLQLLDSVHFEAMCSKPKGFTGQIVTPKLQISPDGKFIGTLDMLGCLNIFKLDNDRSSVSPLARGRSFNRKEINDTNSAGNDLLDDVVDFSWWSDHICPVARKSGAMYLIDVISGKKLLQDESRYCVPIVERANSLLGKLFVLDIPLLKEILSSRDHSEFSYIHDIEQCNDDNEFELSRLQWRLMSFSKRSVPEMFEVLINSKDYEMALDFADRYKMDKDLIYKSQWLQSEQGADDVRIFLSKIKDEVFVLGECVERIGRTEDAVKSLLAYGLKLTNRYTFSLPEIEDDDDIWNFRLSRLQLLQFRDRLETFLGINMGRFSVQEYGKFRVMPINEAAVKLAENGKIGALNLLFKRHPYSLSPFILNILAAIPETIQVQTYSQLLPGRFPPSAIALREKDWVECEHMLKYVRSLPENDERAMVVRTEPVIKLLSGIYWPSTAEITEWYKDRARDIDKFSGLLDNCLCLLDYGCRKGMAELQEFLDDVSYLQQLIYSESAIGEFHSSISLKEWEDLSDYEKFKIMLKDVKDDNVVERLKVRAIQFMQNKCNNRASSPDGEHPREDSFLVRWLKEIAAENHIEICSVVIDEWCRDSQIGFFTSEVEAIDCALHCIYLCGATDRWNTMASIISKLPNVRGAESRNGGLDRRLKVTEGHIEAGRLLALYQVPKPVSYFLEAHNDDKGVKQILRLILSKFARRQPGRADNDWANMWRDLQCLQEKAFPFLDLEYILTEFCRGLLKAGRFGLARNYLNGTGSISLPPEKRENLVIQTAREYFFSASSLSSSEILKAKDCLDLIPKNLSVRLEADIIDALTIKLPNLGVNLLPMQYKQIKDPMDVVKMAITSQAGAYLNVDEIIEVAKLLGLSSQEDISSVQEAIAREAAVAGDLQLAFDLCLVLARKGHGPVWDLCAAIARGPAIENMEVSSRKQLLSFALCHCDDESIGDLLYAWKDLDMQGQAESLMELTGTTPDFTESSALAGEFAEGEEAYLSKIKSLLSKVAKDQPVANGASWDDVLRENGKVLSFADSHLQWLVDLSTDTELGKKFYPSSLPAKQYVSARTQAVITILSWLVRTGFAPRDDLIASLAKSIMEPPATEEEDIIGCSFLLNLIDAFHGVEVIEEQLKSREDYEEICSIMNVGMTYSLLHNTGAECKVPLQRRELLLQKLREKISADDLDKVDKEQSTFWRGWKLKLEEQKREADHTKMLEELIPGVDAARFLSGDSHYMRSVVMTFIESVKLRKNAILKDVLKVADMYSLNRIEVLLKFLACVLVSEVWNNEEIASEISGFKGEILELAAETIKIIISEVYPVIDGCNMERLAFIFGLLSECYFHLGGKTEFHLSRTKQTNLNTALGNFYVVLQQECCRVSFIKGLDFKNIVDIGVGNLNFKHFNQEVCEHINESSVEALAEMVQVLRSACTGGSTDELMSSQDVYRYRVQTELKNLENRARKYHLQNPEILQNLLSDMEQTYDACRKHIKILESHSALVIIKQFFTGVIPLHDCKETTHNDVTWKDCLIVLLNFWTRLSDDLLEIAGSSEEKHGAFVLMVCLKVLLRLIMDGKVTPSQGWGSVYYYANYGSLVSPEADEFCFCRAMVLSGCAFGCTEAVFSEAISQCSIDETEKAGSRNGIGFHDVCDLYTSLLESILSNLVHDSSEQQSLRNLLLSLSRYEGDLEALKMVRTAVWERIAKFSDNLQLPNHVRVYILEVMQSILGGNMKDSLEQDRNILPWEEWDEQNFMSKNTDFVAEEATTNQSVAPDRFKNTLVALKTTQLAASVSSDFEITAYDLQSIDSAVVCFSKLCQAADSRVHFDALQSILGEWESLFVVEKTKETTAETSLASDTGNTWGDDWDEGWDSFQDEEPIQKEEREPSLSVHPLHTCWLEMLKKLVILSEFDEAMRLIDQSSRRSDLMLMNEDDSCYLSQMLIQTDCFMALLLVLLLPYEAVQLNCLDAVEVKLKSEGFPDSVDDRMFLLLIFSSGIISSVISRSAYGATFSYICYLVGNFSRKCQDDQLSKTSQTVADMKGAEGFNLTFSKILFPCFVSELVKADQQILAGFLVTKFMHTNPSLSLINIAEASLKRFLESRLQALDQASVDEARNPSIVQNTLVSLQQKLKNLIRSAISSLPNST